MLMKRMGSQFMWYSCYTSQFFPISWEKCISLGFGSTYHSWGVDGFGLGFRGTILSEYDDSGKVD